MNRTEPPTLIDLPRELLHNIAAECNPPDLGKISRSCRTLHDYILGDRLVFRDVFLRHYDTPSNSHEYDRPEYYENSLKSFTRLSKILESTSSDVKAEHLNDVGEVINHIVKTANIPQCSAHPHVTSRNIAILNRAFKSQQNKDAFLAQSSLFARARGELRKFDSADSERARMSARIHVLYGAPMDPFKIKDKSVRMDKHARSLVYDLRRYTEESFWGPFRPDGSQRVDWERLEAIMLVIQYNLRQFYERTSKRFPLLWHNPWAGIAPRSFVSPVDWRTRKRERDAIAKEAGEEKSEEELAEEAHEEEMRTKDPYNITGTWMRVVCFLDYSDLHAYNFPRENPPDDEPREPLEQEEAIRLITMKLRATRIEPGGPKQAPGSVVTYFEGTSRSMHVGWDPNANSGIRGTVSTTPEGEIRWTSFSVFHGEERWRSEGIQVGGVQSARGVWGNWFDKDFDPEGPAGPTAFWKLTDELPPRPEPRSGVAFNAAENSQPIVVDHQHQHHVQHHHHHNHGFATLGSVAAAGVFGAAAGPTDPESEEQQTQQPETNSRAASATPSAQEEREETPITGQRQGTDDHPYNQVIMTGSDEEEDFDEAEEIMLEIEEDDEDGGGGETYAMPVSEILEILDAGGSDEEEDEDFQPAVEEHH